MKKKQISTYLTEDEIVLFDEACKHYNVSRYKLLDKFVKLGLKSFEKIKKNSNTETTSSHNTILDSNTVVTLSHNTIETVSDSTISISRFQGEEVVQDVLDQSDYSPTKKDRKMISMAEEKLKKLHAMKFVEKNAPEMLSSDVDKTMKKIDDAFNF